jgi:hypothetical protein
MGEYPRRVVAGDLPALTRIWLRFLPRPVQALRTLRIELQQGKAAWNSSSSASISSSRTSASNTETLVSVLIFPVG